MGRKTTRTPSASDRRRLNDLLERIDDERANRAGAGTGGLTPVVPPEEANRIRAESPWYDEDEGWTEPTFPEEARRDRETLEEFIAVRDGFLNDLAEIYGMDTVREREVDKLRRARDRAHAEMRAAHSDHEAEAADES